MPSLPKREHTTWPKLPFPPQFTWSAVAGRADVVVASETFLKEIAQREERHGASVLRDQYLHVVEGTPTFAAKDFLELRWLPGRRDNRFDSGRSYSVLLPLKVPAEVVLLLGTAGAEDGTGGPTVQRFLFTLKHFADAEILAGGEDRLELAVRPKSTLATQLIAERAVQIAPRMGDAASVATKLTHEQSLVLHW